MSIQIWFDGVELYRQRKYDEALVCFQNPEATDGIPATIVDMNIAWTLYMLGHYELALEAAEKSQGGKAYGKHEIIAISKTFLGEYDAEAIDLAIKVYSEKPTTRWYTHKYREYDEGRHTLMTETLSEQIPPRYTSSTYHVKVGSRCAFVVGLSKAVVMKMLYACQAFGLMKLREESRLPLITNLLARAQPGAKARSDVLDLSFYSLERFRELYFEDLKWVCPLLKDPKVMDSLLEHIAQYDEGEDVDALRPRVEEAKVVLEQERRAAEERRIAEEHERRRVAEEAHAERMRILRDPTQLEGMPEGWIPPEGELVPAYGIPRSKWIKKQKSLWAKKIAKEKAQAKKAARAAEKAARAEVAAAKKAAEAAAQAEAEAAEAAARAEAATAAAESGESNVTVLPSPTTPAAGEMPEDWTTDSLGPIPDDPKKKKKWVKKQKAAWKKRVESEELAPTVAAAETEREQSEVEVEAGPVVPVVATPAGEMPEDWTTDSLGPMPEDPKKKKKWLKKQKAVWKKRVEAEAESSAAQEDHVAAAAAPSEAEGQEEPGEVDLEVEEDPAAVAAVATADAPPGAMPEDWTIPSLGPMPVDPKKKKKWVKKQKAAWKKRAAEPALGGEPVPAAAAAPPSSEEIPEDWTHPSLGEMPTDAKKKKKWMKKRSGLWKRHVSGRN